MSLPKNVTRYIKGLMCVFENATCSILSEINNCSHDSLTRVLHGQKVCWQILLTQFIRRTFGKLQDGWLIIDDTIIPKKFARKIESVGWLFDTKIGKNILGINLVLLVWSNGKITLPLAIRVYQKDSGKSKVDLAIELLTWAKKQKIKPKFVAFDSWYPSKELLWKIKEFRWKFVTQFKSNRKLNGIPLKEIQRNPYWMMIGKISCGIRVIIVRNGKKYYATNDLSMSKKELLDAYLGRWKVEMVFRMLHSKLGLNDCQMRKFNSQLAHFYLCLFAYVALERESYDSRRSIYRIKRNCSFRFEQADNILTKLIFQSA
jgi:hypothetical protein